LHGAARAIILVGMSDVTSILSAIERGDPRAAGQLLLLVYDELRRLAARRLAHEGPGQTLQATALVHEAYLRLVEPPPRSPPSKGGEGGVQWNSRGHFFAAAAEAMRRILVEQARRKQSAKRGGGLSRHDCAEAEIAAPQPREDLLALDEALDRLAATDPTAANLVQLRFFAGLTLPEAAEALGVSPRTAGRLWKFARAWLRREVEAGGGPGARL
jgi:RNA polymerase sigma factor (TIGR02999 family)